LFENNEILSFNVGKDVKDVLSLGPDANVGGGINNVWMQLRKVCNHPYLFLNDYVVDDDIIRSSGEWDIGDDIDIIS
jgi:SNF2 family DNA or RNA helicase